MGVNSGDREQSREGKRAGSEERCGPLQGRDYVIAELRVGVDVALELDVFEQVDCDAYHATESYHNHGPAQSKVGGAARANEGGEQGNQAERAQAPGYPLQGCLGVILQPELGCCAGQGETGQDEHEGAYARINSCGVHRVTR